MKISVSRIQSAWSTSFTYSTRYAEEQCEWVICACHDGASLRVFAHGVEGLRSLVLDGIPFQALGGVKRLSAVDLAKGRIGADTGAQLDLEHYFDKVLSNCVRMGRSSPVSTDTMMEIMEMIGLHRESADPEGLSAYLMTYDLMDLEEGARKNHPATGDAKFWRQHWVQIATRIADDAKPVRRKK